MKDKDTRYNHEKEEGIKVTVQLPFTEGSVEHRRMQGVASYMHYPEIGTMMNDLIKLELHSFLRLTGFAKLENALSNEEFNRRFASEEIVGSKKQETNGSDSNKLAHITLPIPFGSGEHYFLEAMAAHTNKDRDAFCMDVLTPFAETVMEEMGGDGQAVALEFAEPRTPAVNAQIAELDALLYDTPQLAVGAGEKEIFPNKNSGEDLDKK